MRWLTIARVLGFLLLVVGGLMLPSLALSIAYGDGEWMHFASTLGLTALGGSALMYFGRNSERGDIRKRDGYFIVAASWVAASLFGALPYYLSGWIPIPLDAFFETASGFTTTGASVLPDIEALPPSLLFWRSTTQWIGGMGIIVLTVAILPLLGIGGMELFASEAPGPTTDKLHPRIRETAKRLWIIYLLLTLVCGGLLDLGGMTAFEAANHAMTTMSSGGFSTRNASIAAWDSNLIHYTVIVFMFLAGTNFTFLYMLYQGRWQKVAQNEEIRMYASLVVLASIVLALLGLRSAEGQMAFRESLFMVVSVVTTTGFVTADYQSWMPFVTLLFLLLMLSGASAGSTSGGIKVVRYGLLFKNTALEMKRILHPRGVIPVRFNGQAVDRGVIYNIMAFVVLYVAIALISVGVFAAMGLQLDTALGATLATLGNIGPGIGQVGPLDNFAALPQAAKGYCSFLMILGRLELFTVLILFSPYFWKQ
jgi:trk system potassium uptake protein TrkH